MNHTAPIQEPAIRSIPLDRLYVALENVRKTPPDAVAEAELKASIANHGLLGNLVVRSDGPDGGYAVVAGDRRLMALKALAADGVLDATHPVPCMVVDGNASSSELSLAENVIRIAMHPADQVIAFTKLTESGVTAAAIAASSPARRSTRARCGAASRRTQMPWTGTVSPRARWPARMPAWVSALPDAQTRASSAIPRERACSITSPAASTYPSPPIGGWSMPRWTT